MFGNLKSTLENLLRNYSISILIIATLCLLFVVWFFLLFPYSDLNAARWTLSALVQSVAALVGLMIVAITFLWTQAITEENNLRRLKDKYMCILMSMRDTRDHWFPKVSFIEQLRQDYFEKIKSNSLPDEIFPYKHKNYKNHKDLFLEICALAVLGQSYFNVDTETHKQQVDAHVQDLSLDDECISVTWRSLIMKANVIDFFFVLYDIFNPANLVLDKLNQGRTLSDKIWNELINDNIDLGLERIRRFRRFKGTLFKMNIFAFIFTMVVGLGVLSSLSESHFNPNLLLLPMTLGIISIGLLTITLNRLLHTD